MARFRLVRRGSEVERDLEDTYASVLSTIPGWSLRRVRAEVRKAIRMCKEQAQKEGTDRLPEGFGDWLIEAAGSGAPPAARIVERARREGARDADIREWWNLAEWQRRMVLWSEQAFRYAAYLAGLEESLPHDAAMMRVRMTFPMYGDPEDTSRVSGDDRALPNELRARVDAYRERHGAAVIEERIRHHSSYNAFVRHEMTNGRL